MESVIHESSPLSAMIASPGPRWNSMAGSVVPMMLWFTEPPGCLVGAAGFYTPTDLLPEGIDVSGPCRSTPGHRAAPPRTQAAPSVSAERHVTAGSIIRAEALSHRTLS